MFAHAFAQGRAEARPSSFFARCLGNDTTMNKVWPFVSNIEVLAVNQAWAGHPGRKIAVPNTTVRAATRPHV